MERSHGSWLGGAAAATVIAYVYGAAQSLGEDTAVASWMTIPMALLVVVGLVLLMLGRRGAAFALSAAAIALGVIGIVVTAAAG